MASSQSVRRSLCLRGEDTGPRAVILKALGVPASGSWLRGSLHRPRSETGGTSGKGPPQGEQAPNPGARRSWGTPAARAMSAGGAQLGPPVTRAGALGTPAPNPATPLWQLPLCVCSPAALCVRQHS